MAPAFLAVGATGNTGRSVVETLSEFLQTSKTFSGYRVLALTRTKDSPVAQHLAQLPSVEVIEKNWVEITADWLREHEVTRAFIASHSQTNQFAEESTFHVAALEAGVEYVVRISTMAANVRPDCPAYYPRSHWAIEAMLSAPAFKSLRWTSLQANVFAPFYLFSVAEFVKQYRKTGEQGTLSLMASEDAKVGIIHPNDVGVFAARLLSQDDISVHNNAKYVLNGPEDITGRQIVDMVEEHIGARVEDVRYKDMSFVDGMAVASPESTNVILSMKRAVEVAWEGKCTTSTTSKEVFELGASSTTPADVFKTVVEG